MDKTLTILEQLGGMNFARITGANNFVLGNDRLSFKLPRNAKNVGMVQIILDPSDTYTMRFFNIRGRELASCSDVYFDMLLDIFESNTELYATLHPRR